MNGAHIQRWLDQLAIEDEPVQILREHWCTLTWLFFSPPKAGAEALARCTVVGGPMSPENAPQPARQIGKQAEFSRRYITFREEP